MHQNSEEIFNTYKELTHQRWAETLISVMVFGPSMNGTTLGSKLRSYILHKCDQYAVTLRCEHADFISSYRSILGTNKNLVFAELQAATFVDAIIIIPDSPGSFTELGMLSPCKHIHRKVLILFKDKYANDHNSFVHEGPKLAFRENHATIKYVNYRKKQSTWEEIRPFLLEQKAYKYENTIISDLVNP